MIVNVLLFGVLAERAGTDSIEVELPDGATVREALEEVARTPGMRDLLDKLKIVLSLNREVAHHDVALNNGDELALIPPNF